MRKTWMGLAAAALVATPYSVRPAAAFAGGDFIVADDAQCQATECAYEKFKL